MKKNKNKLFYIVSFLIYMGLSLFFFILTLMFVSQHAYSFLVSKFSANRYGSDNVVEVIVDDNSLQEYKWPWSKDMFADIFDYFDTYAKPKVIGFDTFIISFDKTNPKDLAFANKISKMDNFVSGIVPDIKDRGDDNSFMTEFKNKFSLDTKIDVVDDTSEYNSIIYPSKILIDANKNYGSVKVNVGENDFSSIFSAINVVKIGNAYYPSLAFKMYLVSHNTNKILINDKFIIVPKTGLKIPYTSSYNGLYNTGIRYYALYPNEYSHNAISAYVILDSYKALKAGITPENRPDLYNPKTGKYLNPELFKDKVIFVGTNISGPSSDVLKTPVLARHSGVDIQASAYDNLENNYFIHKAGFLPVFAFYIILSLFAFVVIMRMNFLKGLLSIIAFDIVYLVFIFVSASKGNTIPFDVPLVLQFVTATFGYSFKFISENRNKEKIKQAMGKYLSQDIMKNVVSNIDDLKLGGKRAIVTVLFSDIRGFTSLSEKMPADEVSMILNEYFSEMEPIITKYNGVINKFIGDAVMAIFGEPIQDINHAKNAVKCAYEMLKKVEYLREKWLFEGKPRIEIGVGINTGEVFIGNIGTETRMEYTVIGDTVNLASRIESYNKVYKTNLLVSSSTYSQISEIADVIKISEVQIRGKAKKMNIYEVLRIDKDK